MNNVCRNTPATRFQNSGNFNLAIACPDEGHSLDAVKENLASITFSLSSSASCLLPLLDLHFGQGSGLLQSKVSQKAQICALILPLEF